MRRALAAAVALAGLWAPAAQAATPSSWPRAFRSCDALLSHARTQALRIAEPYGLPVRPQPGVAVPLGEPGPRGEGDAQAGAPAAGSDSAPSHSNTNVQEQGVDEPDLVKTDGKHVFALTGGKLRAVDVRGAEPKVVDTLDLDLFAQEMLLHDGRIVVFSQAAFGIAGGGPVAAASIAPPVAGATLTEIDARDPSNLAVVRRLDLEGNYVSARVNGSTARVVIGSYPRPIPLAGAEGSDLARRRAAIRRTRLRTWVPRYRLTNARTKRSVRRSMVGCRATRRPVVFSGLGMLTVLTIDLSRGITPVDSDGLMTDARTVYGSRSSLYVASERWVEPGGDLPPRAGRSTTVHRFDARDSDHTTFRASGPVRGFLLNQFSLSEHEGVLRVATTESPLWWTGPGDRDSESYVSVLDESGGVLRTVGQVGGLGRGERIYAVRFVDDTGYVVTFRQVDPLYVLALSDPSAPRVAGELKILGYSAYLHPIADDLLIGVGQDATEEGRARGTQVSLFDVSKPAAPARLDAAALGEGSSSEAEFDHHAFLWWAPSSLAVIPVSTYGSKGRTFTGAVGFRVDRARGVDEAGRVSHEPQSQVRRALVIGDRLFTVSDAGIKASRLDTLGDVAFAGF